MIRALFVLFVVLAALSAIYGLMQDSARLISSAGIFAVLAIALLPTTQPKSNSSDVEQ